MKGQLKINNLKQKGSNTVNNLLKSCRRNKAKKYKIPKSSSRDLLNAASYKSDADLSQEKLDVGIIKVIQSFIVTKTFSRYSRDRRSIGIFLAISFAKSRPS